jgi:ribosomal protein S18 acetylase RimI-like enzyme
MSQNQGPPYWPPPLTPGGVVSPPPQFAARPGIKASPGSGVVERVVQPGSAPPVYRPRPGLQPFQPKTSVAPGLTTQPGPPPVYEPVHATQSLHTRMPSIERQSGLAPPVYRPNAQQGAPVRSANATLQKQLNPGPKAPRLAQQSVYAVQAPMPLSCGVQEIRARLPGAPAVVGSVRLHLAGAGRVYISDLEVSPDHRRHGVARMLINAALRTATAQGHSGAVLEAEPSAQSIPRQALISTYQKLGFRQAGLSSRGRPLMEYGPAAIHRKTHAAYKALPSALGLGPGVIQGSRKRALSGAQSGKGLWPDDVGGAAGSSSSSAAPLLQPRMPSVAAPGYRLGSPPPVYRPRSTPSLLGGELPVAAPGSSPMKTVRSINGPVSPPAVRSALTHAAPNVVQPMEATGVGQVYQGDTAITFYRFKAGAKQGVVTSGTAAGRGPLEQARLGNTEAGLTKGTRVLPKHEERTVSHVTLVKYVLHQTDAHWELLCRVDPIKKVNPVTGEEVVSKTGTKYMKIDLLASGYRIYYGVAPTFDTTRYPDSERLSFVLPRPTPVMEVYEAFVKIAKQLGKWTSTEVYNCQDFAIAMLEELKVNPAAETKWRTLAKASLSGSPEQAEKEGWSLTFPKGLEHPYLTPTSTTVQ